jgi:outer membrane lipoprotein-sorting protein
MITAIPLAAVRAAALAACAALALAGPALADAPQAAGGDLYHRMVQVNAKLKTYTATVHMDAKLKSFIPFNPTLDGNVYYKQPDKQAVVFDTVPALASQFKKVYPKIDPPVTWEKIYDFTVLSDQNGTTTFRLVPKKNGRVEHLDVNVDDGSATIKGYTWTYKDGGYIAFEQTFKTIDGNYLPLKVSGHVELPSYKADVTTEFSNYKLNVPVADSVFDEK